MCSPVACRILYGFYRGVVSIRVCPVVPLHSGVPIFKLKDRKTYSYFCEILGNLQRPVEGT